MEKPLFYNRINTVSQTNSVHSSSASENVDSQFLIQNKLKNLDLSYKPDLDSWDYFGKEKPASYNRINTESLTNSVLTLSIQDLMVS